MRHRHTPEVSDTEPSLEALETSVDWTPNQQRFDRKAVVEFGNTFEFLHDRYKQPRRKLLEVLRESEDTTLQKLGRRIYDCGAFPVVYADQENHISVGSSYCKARLCPLCSDRRARDLKLRVHGIVQKWTDLRHLTLTPLSTNAPLQDSIDKLVKDFRNLRQRPVWKQHVRGGVATIEVTLNSETGFWHPHLHVLIDGDYFPHQIISDTWKDVTGDSSVVWIKRFIKKSRAANYITKYIAKPADFIKWPGQRLTEFVKALTGRRTMITFGTSYRDLRVDDEDDSILSIRRNIATVFSIRFCLKINTPFAREWAAAAALLQPKLYKLVIKSLPFDFVPPPMAIGLSDVDLIRLCGECDAYYFDGTIPYRYVIQPEPLPVTMLLKYA